jgi:AraC-like DNA-binding protein
MATPTVSTAFVRSAVRVLGDAARASALAQAGIDAHAALQADGRVPPQAFADLWLAVAERLDDEFFGLDSRRMKVGSFAMLCQSLAGLRPPGSDAAALPSVGLALRAALRGFGLFLDDIAATLRLGSEGAALVIASRIGHRLGAAAQAADARRFADETLLVMLHGLLCWLVGRRVVPTRLDWAHPAPPHAAEYRRMFAQDVRFDAPATALVFDARVLDGAVAVNAATLRAFLRDAPQSIFLKQVAGAGVSDQVRRHLREALDQGQRLPALGTLARRLGLSPATLRRRLLAEGAGWQPLKSAVQRELAQRHLAAGTMTVADIAAQLGFEDASTFYRAFRQWTGQTPAAWRAAQRTGGGR